MRALLGVATCVLAAPFAPATAMAPECEPAIPATATAADSLDLQVWPADGQVQRAIQPVGPEIEPYPAFEFAPDPFFVERRKRHRLTLPDLARDIPARG